MSVACAILTDFVTAEFADADRPLFLSDEPTESQMFLNIGSIASELHATDPTGLSEHEWKAVLKEEKRISELIPTQNCSELERLRVEKSYDVPKHQKIPVTTADGLFYYYDTLVVQVPFIDEENGEARFEVARGCGPLCGSGSFITYKKNADGQWQKLKEETTWIS